MKNPNPLSSQIVLVDLHDQPIGYMEKMEVHRQGLLHRAVSVFLFNAHGEWLLQRRALHKYHSGGLWSNACCTHPYPDEAPDTAARRRTGEELGLSCPLEKRFCFLYKTALDHGLTEYEYDHVFTGITTELPEINPAEVREWGYFNSDFLIRDIEAHPGYYTVWFRKIFPEILKHH